MARYAEGTKTTVEVSRKELVRLLKRYEIKRYAERIDEDTGQSEVEFELNGRWYRVGVQPPTLDEYRTPVPRAARPIDSEWDSDLKTWVFGERARVKRRDAEIRRRWRVLLLLMKAKLEVIGDGTDVTSAEREFLPYLMLADGGTLGDALEPVVDHYYQTGQLPQMLALPKLEEE